MEVTIPCMLIKREGLDALGCAVNHEFSAIGKGVVLADWPLL
jgi:hypothetical protein